MQLPTLIPWYRLNKRNLPWRESKNPYQIWLSEVILQQTKVTQGLPYYNRIVSKYPDISHLSKSKKDDFFKLWQGLGYYNRAENLLATAKFIQHELNGKFPETYQQLIQLKGIGSYTAAAIASIAFNEPKAVLDGNVLRVLSRIFALGEDIASAKGKKIFAELAQDILDKSNPADFNQAMMELGALICLPKNPLCIHCPVQDQCQAFIQRTTANFPVKSQKKKPVKRILHFVYLIDKNNTYLLERTDRDIWKNLYEPYNFEYPVTGLTELQLLNLLTEHEVVKKSTKMKVIDQYNTKHTLTHQQIEAVFWVVNNALPSPSFLKRAITVPINLVHTYPIHRLFDKFLNYYNLQQ